MIPCLPGKALRSLVKRVACRAIRHAFSLAEPGKLDIKDANLVFFNLKVYELSVYKLIFTVQTIDYDVGINFRVNSMSLTTSFK